ncbi:MAG: FAD-dependent oxidoreductase, partial [Clostridia bacterium]|nr:FAD-dependent oxidoreductase [Clostridia bacterium]
MKQYDAVVIGGGTAGIFTAFELNHLRPDLKIAIVERGNPLSKRVCPIVAGKTDHCIHCKHCSIMNGFGGAGAFSDGKFNFTTEFGGWLHDYVPSQQVMELIEYVDSVNVQFGATQERYSTFSKEALQLEKEALQHDLHLLKAQVKHLGTERNLTILGHIYDYLAERLDILCDTTVADIRPNDQGG